MLPFSGAARLLPFVLLLGACAGPRTEVTATANPAADFRAYKTYAFVPVERLDLSGSQMGDPVTRRNLEAVIGRDLQARGLSPAADDARPSLLVSYFADVYEGPVPESKLMDNWERQGKFTIDLVDASTGQLVWRGEGWARNPDRGIAERVILDVLRKYP